MKNVFFVLLIISLLFLNGCQAVKLSSLSSGVQGLFAKKVDVKGFRARSKESFDVSLGVKSVAVSVNALPSVARVDFKMGKNEQILAVRLVEDKHLNVDRFLLTGYKIDDYIYDTNESTLSVNFDLPVVYFMQNPLVYKLDIYMYDQYKNDKYYIQSKDIAFNWHQRKAVDGKAGFSYYYALEELPRKDLSLLRSTAKEELSDTNTKRLDQKYMQSVNGFVSGN